MTNTLTRSAAALAMLAAVAACSDAPVGPHGSTPLAAKGGPSIMSGGASGDVTVSGSFTIAGGGQWVILGYHESPQPAAAGGICGDGTTYAQGTWVKTTPGTTHLHELHVHCTIKEWREESVTVTFSIAGNLVLAGSGNINLNLDPLCDVNGCTDRKIQYRQSQDDTRGDGILLGSGSDGSAWVLDLGQIDHPGNSRGDPNFDGIGLRSYNGLTATRQGSSDSYDQVTLSW